MTHTNTPYELSRNEMIDNKIAIPVEWSDGSEGYLTCTQTLQIETVEQDENDCSGWERVVVTDPEQNLIRREGRIVSIDYSDFVEDFYGE